MQKKLYWTSALTHVQITDSHPIPAPESLNPYQCQSANTPTGPNQDNMVTFLCQLQFLHWSLPPIRESTIFTAKDHHKLEKSTKRYCPPRVQTYVSQFDQLCFWHIFAEQQGSALKTCLKMALRAPRRIRRARLLKQWQPSWKMFSCTKTSLKVLFFIRTDF